MEVGSVKTIDYTINTPSTSSIPAKNVEEGHSGTLKAELEHKNMSAGQEKPTGEKKEINKEELVEMNAALNKFLQIINSDIQFALHEKTQRLMVQVVDSKEQKVLREFPAHELLDTMAKIREYVGAILDKKA